MNVRSGGCLDRQTAESDDAVLPIAFERRISNALARRSVEESVLVRDNAHMAKSVQEHERSELKAVVAIYRFRLRPQRTCAYTREVDSRIIEYAPYEPRAIICVRARRTVSIWNAPTGHNALIDHIADACAVRGAAGRKCGRVVIYCTRRRCLLYERSCGLRFYENYRA